MTDVKKRKVSDVFDEVKIKLTQEEIRAKQAKKHEIEQEKKKKIIDLQVDRLLEIIKLPAISKRGWVVVESKYCEIEVGIKLRDGGFTTTPGCKAYTVCISWTNEITHGDLINIAETQAPYRIPN